MLKHSLIALAALGAGIVGFSATPAEAMPVQTPTIKMDAASPLLVEVKHRKYHRGRHGDRRRYRSQRFRHYHGGYWYDNPWWILPMLGAGIALGSRDRHYGGNHVEWCLNRYNSYNPRNNTWRSYSGRVRQCISPYGP